MSLFNKVPKIYIASPFSHKYKKVMREREKAVNTVIAELTYKFGYAFFGPITQSAPMERIIPALGGSFEQWKNIDLTWVNACDELWVVMLDGWDISIGVTEEIKYATELGKIVRYINPLSYEFVTRRELIQKGIINA